MEVELVSIFLNMITTILFEKNLFKDFEYNTYEGFYWHHILIFFRLAGFTCADMLRQNGFRGRVLLFTREGTLPYDRVSY